MKEYKVGHCIYQIYESGRCEISNSYNCEAVEVTPDELRTLVKLLENEHWGEF